MQNRIINRPKKLAYCAQAYLPDQFWLLGLLQLEHDTAINADMNNACTMYSSICGCSLGKHLGGVGMYISMGLTLMYIKWSHYYIERLR